MNGLQRKLIAKDIRAHRWLIVGALAGSFTSIAIIALGGKSASSVGFIMWLTAVIAFGVVLPMFNVLNERKDRSLQFLLSLPLSPADYARAKMLGLLLAYLLCWLPSAAGMALLVLFKDAIVNGQLPGSILLSVFLLMNFSIILGSVLNTQSEGVMGGIIIATNLSVSLFLMFISRLPGIASHSEGATPVWSNDFWAVLGGMLCVLAVVLTSVLAIAARRRDMP